MLTGVLRATLQYLISASRTQPRDARRQIPRCWVRKSADESCSQAATEATTSRCVGSRGTVCDYEPRWSLQRLLAPCAELVSVT